MALPAYSKYRLYITKNSANSLDFVSVAEFKAFEAIDGSGTNLLTGTASSSSNYSGAPPSNAFDGNPTTGWASNNTGAAFQWLRNDLVSAVTARNFFIRSSPGGYQQIPRDFIIQGSNDGSAWEDIIRVDGWVPIGTTGTKEGTILVGISVSGESVLDTGAASSKVLVHNYATGALIAAITPNITTGAWRLNLQTTDEVLVTHIGPSGYRPLSDGPITPHME